MQDLFLTLLGISLGVSAVILLIKALSPLLDKRFHPKWRYWVWLVLALRLLIPLHVSFSAPRVQVQMPPVLSTPLVVVDTAPADPDWQAPVQTPGSNEQTTTPQTPSIWQTISPLDIFALIWAVGAVGYLLYQLVSYRRFSKRLRRWMRPAEQAQTLALYAQIKEKMRIARPIPLFYSEMVQSPMMLGFVRPMLVLPFCEYAPEDFAFILRHELTHYRRRDLYYKLLLVVVNALHWFNPLVYLMVHTANADLELTCDSEVTRNLDFEGKKAYSETILSCVHRQQQRQTALSTYFWGGTKMLKKRFQNILFGRSRRRGVVVMAVLALCGVLAGSLVACSPGAQAAKTPQEVAYEYLNAEKEQDYTLDLQIHTVEEDKTEALRMSANLSGSDLAQENGWDDAYLAQNFTAVYASYTVDYDNTLTFKDEGDIECFLYLTRENADGEWAVWDVSYDMSSRETNGENASSQATPVLTEESAQAAIRQTLSTLTVGQNGQISFTLPQALPQDPSGNTLLTITLNATYRLDDGSYSSDSLLDWETDLTPGQSYSFSADTDGQLTEVMLRAAYMTQVAPNQYQEYAANYTQLTAPFSGEPAGFDSPSVQINGTDNVQLVYTSRAGEAFVLNLQLPAQTSLTLFSSQSASAFPSLSVNKNGEQIGTLCLYGYGTTDAQDLAGIDTSSQTLPMQIYSTIALANHVDYQNGYRVVSSTEYSSNAVCRMLYHDLGSLVEQGGSAASLPWLENDCILAYNLASQPYFVAITLSPDALSAQELTDLAASISIWDAN